MEKDPETASQDSQASNPSSPTDHPSPQQYTDAAHLLLLMNSHSPLPIPHPVLFPTTLSTSLSNALSSTLCTSFSTPLSTTLSATLCDTDSLCESLDKGGGGGSESTDSDHSVEGLPGGVSGVGARGVGVEERGAGERGHPERKRRASNDSTDSGVTRVSGEGVGEEDEEEEEGAGAGISDPDRLKAFNMFVRLFVDENLDRMVPISKQPKEKVQAILEACERQFPEYRERARKRIRTYLKSCRRLKRNVNGQEVAVKQTPPHLTSAAAENILAHACENESHNAKRMRMGLEPLPANLMTQSASAAVPTLSPDRPSSKLDARDRASSSPPAHTSPSPLTTPTSGRTCRPSPATHNHKHTASAGADFNSQSAKTPLLYRPELAANLMTSHALTSQDLATQFLAGGGSALLRATCGFAAFAPSGGAQASLLHTSLLSGALQNGPTDLSIKKPTLATSKPGLSCSAGLTGLTGAAAGHASSPLAAAFTGPRFGGGALSAAEVSTMRQLIAGYRESAAFLYRSADELAQLLLQQSNNYGLA